MAESTISCPEQNGQEQSLQAATSVSNVHSLSGENRQTLSSGKASPTLQVEYCDPEFVIPAPNDVHNNNLGLVARSGSATIVKVSPTVVAKYGPHVSLAEARTLHFLAKKNIGKVPKLYAAYKHGPFDRDIDDHGSLYDTYIFIDFIEGQTLWDAWPTYDVTTKEQICTELRDFMIALHGLEGGTYIGSVNNGPVTDMILEYKSPTKGPFDNEAEFNEAIATTYANLIKGHVRQYVLSMLSSKKHSIIFCHGDFRPANIIIKDGHFAAMLDWELSGWYPEYWDFAKAFYIEHFVTDWAEYISRIMPPFWGEHAIHCLVSRRDIVG